MTAVKEMLTEAKALLVEKGWCQGQARNLFGEHCSIGALWQAAGCYDRSPCAGNLAEAEAALEAVIVPHGDIVGWNDEEGRTVEEVLAAFDRAIAAEDNKESHANA